MLLPLTKTSIIRPWSLTTSGTHWPTGTAQGVC
jgi:hypothetical protein